MLGDRRTTEPDTSDTTLVVLGPHCVKAFDRYRNVPRLNAHHPHQGSDIVDNLSRRRFLQAGRHARADGADRQHH